MQYALTLILFFVATAFSQNQVVDTVYTDTHKVTYIIDSTGTTTNSTDAETISEKTDDEKDLGLNAPPNNNHRILLSLTAQSLSFALGYEYLFSDFWSVGLQFGHIGYDKDEIKRHTDVQGTIDIFTFPISLKWIWGRRNIGKYHYVDALGNNHYKKQRQAEGFIQAKAAPVLYNLDVHRDSSSFSHKLDLKEKEYAAYITAGFGFNLCFEHFIFATEINLGTFVSKPKFQEKTSTHNTFYEIHIAKDRYGTHLLDKTVIESTISIGWVF